MHFGNTDQASNRDAQYVIVSPTGTDPDGWENRVDGYCAYHDDTHDPSIDGGGAVSGPILAFTNLPYVPDAGADCGAGMVNDPGHPRRRHVGGQPRVRRDRHRPVPRGATRCRVDQRLRRARSPTSAPT